MTLAATSSPLDQVCVTTLKPLGITLLKMLSLYEMQKGKLPSKVGLLGEVQ